jgi:hypothetical protein
MINGGETHDFFRLIYKLIGYLGTFFRNAESPFPLSSLSLSLSLSREQFGVKLEMLRETAWSFSSIARQKRTKCGFLQLMFV